MPFLMVPITNPKSINKWVILGWKVDFSQFSPKCFNRFEYRFPTYSTQMIFYDLECYSSISSSKWHQFHVSAPSQTVTINGFMWNPAFWNEYRRFLEKAYKKFI